MGNISIQPRSTGQIVKVTAVSEDGCRVFLELRNSLSGWFGQQESVHDVGIPLIHTTDLSNGQFRPRASKYV